ncbi:MAG TPA: phosphatase PAP2 family protein [Bacilli bacterium]
MSEFDSVTEEFIRGLASEGLTTAANMITRLGSGKVEGLIWLIIICFLIFLKKRYLDAIFVTISCGGGWRLNYMLKWTFKRERPLYENIAQVDGFSFPSGHAMVGTAFYGMVGFLIWDHLRRQGKPAWPIAVITTIFLLVLGLTRIYLGVHYTSDVLAGYIAGGAWLAVCIVVLTKLRNKI